MKSATTWSLGFLVLAVSVPVQDPDSRISFERDNKENVVGSRLQGTWELDPGLTRRLEGHEWIRELTFTLDWSVIPDRVFQELGERLQGTSMRMTVYAAGLVTGLSDGEVPFFLTTIHGTPRILWFRNRNGNRFGDVESANVMVATARNREDDLLFRGGDFNNQPFTAYKRKQ